MKIHQLKYLFLLFLFSSCATIHHISLNEVDSETVLKGRKFELKVSELGFDLKEASDIAKIAIRSKKGKQKADGIQGIISLFQMGPKTGNPILDDSYADKIFKRIKVQCPSLKISGLTSVRETAKYPVISGEIVKITGYCLDK